MRPTLRASLTSESPGAPAAFAAADRGIGCRGDRKTGGGETQYQVIGILAHRKMLAPRAPRP